MINDPTVPGTELTTAQTGLTQQVNSPQFNNFGQQQGMRGLGANSWIQNPANGQAMNTSFWRNPNGSFNMNSVGTVIDGIGAVAGIWNAFQQQKLAREQMKFQKSTFNKQLGDQRQSYNTALEDRIRARHAFEGKGSGATDNYLSKHSL